jgi:ribosomal protein L37E
MRSYDEAAKQITHCASGVHREIRKMEWNKTGIPEKDFVGFLSQKVQNLI